MIPVDQQSSSSLQPQSIHQQNNASQSQNRPQSSNQMAEFVPDTIRQMFSCLSSENHDDSQLGCQYLNGTSDLFQDEFNLDELVTTSPGSGSQVEAFNWDSPGPTTSGKRASVKRRKNSKLGHKVDCNLNKTENESEESIHVYQEESPIQTSTPTKKKPSQLLTPQQQFDSTLSQLSSHLTSLQEEVDKVVNGSVKQTTTSDNIATSSKPIHLQPDNSILSLLQQIFRDLNKVKRFLTLKSAGNRRRGSQDEAATAGSSTSVPNSPITSSPALYNNNMDRLLQNRFLMLQILHLECTILRYLRQLEESLNQDAGAILSMDHFAIVQLRLEELSRAYYALLTKLSYEPSFLKVVSLVHRSTVTNGTCLLLIIFRSLAMQSGEETIPHKKATAAAADDSAMSLLQGEEKNHILTVEHDSEKAKFDINMVGQTSQAPPPGHETNDTTGSSDSRVALANNRAIVLILTFLQNLAKNDVFPSRFSSTPEKGTVADMFDMVMKGKATASRFEGTSLVSVCRQILAQFCPPNWSEAEFPLKSTVRQHAIETLAYLCLTRDGLYDAIQLGSSLLQTVLSLLSQCASTHTEVVCSKSFLSQSSITPTNGGHSHMNQRNFSDQKTYLAILRDIYGLLSILISLTEFKSGREYLLFHNVASSLYQMFMLPFIETLNGTESADPRHLRDCSNDEDSLGDYIGDRAQAYVQLRLTFAADQKTQRYLDRIVGICSIIVQRLLDPLVIPVEGAEHNPFVFDLPSVHSAKRSELNCQQENSNKEAAANDSGSSPTDLTDELSKKNFTFDSDLDENENDNEDEDSDEEDSYMQQGESSNDNIQVTDDSSEAKTGANSVKMPAPGTAGQEQEDEADLLRSYLRFFPEVKHFKWDSLDVPGSDVLSCECGTELEQFLTRNGLTRSVLSDDSANSSVLSPPPAFQWSAVYENMSRNTRSVMPSLSMALPERNFINAVSERNELVQPMTYPFLDRVVRRKNYHHIKMLDHVNERLSARENRPTYQVVYDVESEHNQASTHGYLQFDSKFECGNLRRVLVKKHRCDGTETNTQLEEEEYLLLLNSDVNSSIHTQWFYFAVGGMRPGKRYRFKIINMQKKSILYNSGQQPVFYSQRDFALSRKQWQRTGVSERQPWWRPVVAYYRNHYAHSNSVASLFSDRPFYTLEFTFMFPHQDDVCYFAYNMPFSYTFLKTNLSYWANLVQHHNHNLAQNSIHQNESSPPAIYFNTQTLCSTLKGNDLPVMTITSDGAHERGKPHYILLTARVHPSESNSSWILKGFIDFLLNQSTDERNEQLRRKLLQNYVFKVVPMLNPDGVINGCTRTDLQKDDLNRHWHAPDPLLHPTIYHCRMMLKCLNKFSSGRNPVAFLDLHGHSRRKNIFSYSCSPLLSWKKSDRLSYRKQTSNNHFCVCPPHPGAKACQLQDQMRQLKMKAQTDLLSEDSCSAKNGFYLLPPFVTLPVLLHLQQAPSFNLENCSFVVQKDREHTARIVGWREFDISLSYTIECTASGCNDGPYAGQHLHINHLEEMGAFIARSFGYLDFLYCSRRHVPLIVMPKLLQHRLMIAQQTPSPIRHPGNDDYLKNLLMKCTKRYTRANYEQNRVQMRKLIQMYPDLNMLSGSVASSSDSSLSSSATSLASQPSSPKKMNPINSSAP